MYTQVCVYILVMRQQCCLAGTYSIVHHWRQACPSAHISHYRYINFLRILVLISIILYAILSCFLSLTNSSDNQTIYPR
jgi:hypothetical protein